MQHLHKAPKLRSLKTIILPNVEEYCGASNIPIYEILKPLCNVVRLELVFLAGRPYENKKLVSTCCSFMMREGTKEMSSEELSEKIDFYGASLNITASLDTINVSIVCMKKHFTEVLNIVKSIILAPTFPEDELEILKNRRVERLKIDLAKNEIVSYRHLTESIFGSSHAYGYNSTEAMYRQINRSELVSYFHEHIHSGNCNVFLAGDVSPSIRTDLEGLLKEISVGKDSRILETNLKIQSSLSRHLRKSGNITQSSIRIGRRLFNRSHEDYYGLLFVSTILGGYFSSRLSANIREEKGLTYGIHSMMDTQVYDGSLIISTDVASDKVELTLKEIYLEMERLRQEKVSDTELKLVRNYLAGNYINFFDGPFNSIRAIKSLVLSQVPLSDLKSLINISQSISSEQVLNISQKYLDRNDFWEVIVGTSPDNKLTKDSRIENGTF